MCIFVISEKTIALDLDSVLADVMKIWVEEYNLLYNTNIQKKDILEWHIHYILPLSENEISNLFIDVWRNRWRDIPPTSNDLSNVTASLQDKGFRISIITKRERETIAFVANWLDYHNIFLNDVIFIFDNISKLHYPFFLLVDDSPMTIKEILKPKRIIIFDQPWNQFLNGYPRISQLNELIKIL